MMQMDGINMSMKPHWQQNLFLASYNSVVMMSMLLPAGSFYQTQQRMEVKNSE